MSATVLGHNGGAHRKAPLLAYFLCRRVSWDVTRSYSSQVYRVPLAVAAQLLLVGNLTSAIGGGVVRRV